MPESLGGDDPLQGVIARLDRVLSSQTAPPAALAGSRASLPAPEPVQPLTNDLIDRWRLLVDAGAQLNSPSNAFDSALEAVLDTAIAVTRARRGFVFLQNEQGGLDAKLGRDHKHQTLDAADDLPRSLVDKVCDEAQPLLVPDVAVEAGAASAGLRAAICVPLTAYPSSPRRAGDPEGPGASNGDGKERRRYTERARQEMLGCIYVDGPAGPDTFREGDLYLLLVLANHVTTALLRERLYREAISDPLTRLFTRGHLTRQLERAARTFETTRVPYSLLMLDIDHFRELNDRLGHVVGDNLLRELTEVLVSTMRGDDLCFRYGGDELAVLLLDTDAEGAQTTADKLLAAVGGRRFAEDSKLTLSVGLASCPAHASGPSDLVRKADQALFAAKKKGRARALEWTPDLGPTAPREDRLAGVITGDPARDYANVALLVETFAALGRTHDVHEVLTMAVDKAIEASDAERGAIMLADEKGSLATIVARGRNRATLELRERFSRSIPEKVLRSGESVYVVTADEPRPSESESMRELGLRTVLCAPLTTDSGRIGCLYVDAKKGQQEILAGTLPFFAALARHIALAVENARLRARLHLEGGR